jgi:predicted metal-binding membrane protein
MRDDTAGFMARAMSRRERVAVWTTLGLAAAISWAQLFTGARMPEAMHGSLFLLMWFWMVGAMMLPALGPVVTAGAELLHHAPSVIRLLHLALFVLAYLGLWSSFGIAALAVHKLSTGRPLLVAGLVALAGLYQLGTFKAASLLRCRNPEGYFLQYGSRLASAVGSLTIRQAPRSRVQQGSSC